MSLLKSLISLQVGEIGYILTTLYTILILPIMLLYRSMEMEMGMTQTEDNHQEVRRVRDNHKYPPLYQGGKDTQDRKAVLSNYMSNIVYNCMYKQVGAF